MIFYKIFFKNKTLSPEQKRLEFQMRGNRELMILLEKRLKKKKPILKQVVSGICIALYIIAIGLLFMANYVMWILAREILVSVYKGLGFAFVCISFMGLIGYVYRWSNKYVK